MSYVNRDGKAFSDVLVTIAKRSPRAYADQIRERNLRLLEQLKLFEPYLGAAEEDMEDFDTPKFVRIGCPHCSLVNFSYQCESCLWTKVTGDRHLACIDVEFPSGESLSTQGEKYALRADYCHDSAFISFRRSGMYEATPELYNGIRKFLEDHVDWASLDCWGQDCEVKDGHEKAID